MDDENRETWQARLWIGNDEGLYHHARYIVAEDGTDSDLRAFIEEVLPEQTGLLGDIIGLWLDRVDWSAVREGLTDE